MALLVCLIGLLFCNYVLVNSSSNLQVEEIPSLVEDNDDEAGLHHHEDVYRNKTEIQLDKEVAMEETEYGGNTKSDETLTAEDLKDYIECNMDGINLDLDRSELNMTKDILEDFSEETELNGNSAKQFTGLNETSTEIKELDKVTVTTVQNTNSDDGEKDKDVLNEEYLAAEGLIEITDTNVKSRCEQNEPDDITEADEEDKDMLWLLVEQDVMDELKAFEEVDRCSRALVPGILPPYFTKEYLNYNMVDSLGNIEVAVKQRIPVKGKVKIARTFNNFHCNMRPTFTSNGNKEVVFHDNIAMESVPLPDNSIYIPQHSNTHGVEETLIRKVPASGKFTVAATFC